MAPFLFACGGRRDNLATLSFQLGTKHLGLLVCDLFNASIPLDNCEGELSVDAAGQPSEGGHSW